EETRERYTARRIANAKITIAGERVVHQHARAEERPALTTTRVRRDHHGDGMHQMRRHAQHDAALRTGLPQAPQVRMLQVADPAMHELVRVGGYARREIGSLH